MNAQLSVREKLHQYIDDADDNKVMAIYTLLEGEIEHAYSEGNIAEFHKRRNSYLSGNSAGYTVTEVLENIRKTK